MKKIVVVVVLSFVLLFTSCGGATIEKGKKLLSEKKYIEAIEVFEKLIEKDETNYEAWYGKIKAQIKDDEYRDAEDTLEELFGIIEEHYDDDKDVDYAAVIEEYQEYADDIVKEEGGLGSWYEKVQPPKIDISNMDYMSYPVDSTQEIDVPKGVNVYYNLNEKKVTVTDKLYKKGIVFDTEGSFTLTVAAINKYGIKGEESTAFVNIADIPDAPSVDPISGTYPSPLVVTFKGFNANTQTIYYTSDGTDPKTNGLSYYPEDGVYLPTGQYELKAVIYDSSSGLFSAEGITDYIVEAAPAPTASAGSGTYTGPYTIYFSGFDPMNNDVLYTLDGSDPTDNGIYYYPDHGIELTQGEYNLRAVIYDFWTYSKEYTATYTIK